MNSQKMAEAESGFGISKEKEPKVCFKCNVSMYLHQTGRLVIETTRELHPPGQYSSIHIHRIARKAIYSTATLPHCREDERKEYLR
jgi:hypothetical protein